MRARKLPLRYHGTTRKQGTSLLLMESGGIPLSYHERRMSEEIPITFWTWSWWTWLACNTSQTMEMSCSSSILLKHQLKFLLNVCGRNQLHVDGRISTKLAAGEYCSQWTKKIFAKYHRLMTSKRGNKLLREFVDDTLVRPALPCEPPCFVCFAVDDDIDFFHNDGWWEGVFIVV